MELWGRSVDIVLDAITDVSFRSAMANYSKRRVGVTGHTGFKGVWLSHMLYLAKAELYGFALPPTPPERNLFTQTNCFEHYKKSTFGDLRDEVAIKAWVDESDPEVIFHLASQPLVSLSYADPRETLEANVLGLVNLLEAVRQNQNVKAVVIVTSDKCYANDGSGLPFTENSPLGAGDPYSASKACAEIISKSYRESFFVDNQGPLLATARAGNVIGGVIGLKIG